MEGRLRSVANRIPLVLAIVLGVGLFSIAREVFAGQGPLYGKTFVIETVETGETGETRIPFPSRTAIFILPDVTGTDLVKAPTRRP